MRPRKMLPPPTITPTWIPAFARLMISRASPSMASRSNPQSLLPANAPPLILTTTRLYLCMGDPSPELLAVCIFEPVVMTQVACHHPNVHVRVGVYLFAAREGMTHWSGRHKKRALKKCEMVR